MKPTTKQLLRKVIKEEVRKILKETSTPEQRKEIEDYFYDYDVSLTDKFNLDAFAKEVGLPIEGAVVALVNLEDSSIMQDIAKGDYTTFDLDDDDQFNDMYHHMMYDLRRMTKNKK